jgi:hypothetical protein
MRVHNSALDVQIISYDPSVPPNRLLALQVHDTTLLDIKSEQVRAVGKSALARWVCVPPSLTMGCHIIRVVSSQHRNRIG